MGSLQAYRPSRRQSLPLGTSGGELHLKKSALKEGQSRAETLARMVPDWPLRLVISPLSNITLSIEQRDVLHIPASAISYTWVYPASLDWRDVPQVRSLQPIAWLCTKSSHCAYMAYPFLYCT